MAAWRRLPSPARGGLIAAVSAVFGAAAAILVSASGLVDSQIPSIGAPSTVTVTAAPDATGLEPVPSAPASTPKDRFGDSPKGKPFYVGVDVLEGQYVSPPPRRAEACTWRRERESVGQAPTQRSDGFTRSGSSTMTLRVGDQVTTSGCDWVRKP
jgi:hypothetical protein